MHWVGLRTLILREFGVSVRFWSVTLAPPVITTILYFTIFGEIIGARIGSIDGIDYIRVPGARDSSCCGSSPIPSGTRQEVC